MIHDGSNPLVCHLNTRFVKRDEANRKSDFVQKGVNKAAFFVQHHKLNNVELKQRWCFPTKNEES